MALDPTVRRVLHFDCFSGAAGDMIVGALLDAGLPFGVLQRALGPLALDVELQVEKVVRGGISASKFRVVERTPATGHPHRHLRGIVALVEKADTSASARARAIDLLTRLATIEAGIHGQPLEKVHLHEVGGTDSIVDVLGAVVGLEWFGAERVTCSALNVGSGTVTTAHGVLPVPAPATAKLIEGVPVYADGPQMELLTPTGALLLTGYAERFGPMAPMRIRSVGYGAGDRDTPGRANVVRVLVGDAVAPEDEAEETVVLVECQVDDVPGQVLGALVDRALQAGALDVLLAPVGMKKSRPGTAITVVARPEDRQQLVDLLFREVPTLGVRYHEERRQRLARHHETVETAYGPVRVKIGRRAGVVTSVAPEFEDCARAAAQHDVAVREVLDAALRAWRRNPSPAS